MANKDSGIVKYEEECRRELVEFLEGNFLNCDPFNQEDASIILDADARSRDWTHKGRGYLSQTAQFCSLWVMDGPVTRIYEPDRYVEALQLHPLNYKDSNRIEIPFNHFQYPMMLDKGLGEAYEEKQARYACSLDDHHDRDVILSGNYRLVIYGYYLGGITKFGQKRNIYRLSTFTKETLPDVLRREILKAQAAAIRYVTTYAEYCRPDYGDYHISGRVAAEIMRSVCNDMESSIWQKSEDICDRLEEAGIRIEKF